MKKNILLTFIASMCVLCAWAYDFQSGDLYYNITSDSTVEVTSQKPWSPDNYSGLTSAVIPESVTYNGTTYCVTSIGKRAFFRCSGLTSVTIPNSVTSVGERAFSGCSGLTSMVVKGGNTVYDSRNNCNAIVETVSNTLIAGCQNTIIPNGITSIGGLAFEGCIGLASITIPDSVTSIGNSAFFGCSGLISITISNSVSSIGESAFYNCSGLTSITLPNSVTSIGKSAFYNCSGLTSITIPDSVTSIGESAFFNCSGFTSMAVKDGNTVYDSRNNCNAIVETASNTLIAGCQNTIIPNSVTSIGNDAFYNCSGLTSITIPDNVTSIGESAFSGCGSLTSITIPYSVTSIGNRAFLGCSGLTSITIPNSVTTIGGTAFYKCSGLVSITIPDSVTSIGDRAFSGCSGLTSVIWNAKNCAGWSRYSYAPFYDVRDNITSFSFGNEVEIIPDYICDAMSKLTSVAIPNSVTSIGKSAFYGCTNLMSVTIPSSVTNIGEEAFYDVPNIAYCGTAPGAPWGANNIIVTTNYLEGYFTYTDFSKTTLLACNKAATGAIAIPNSVTSIGDSAFYNCDDLTSITIPNSVTSIGSCAFMDCNSLTSITIPNSVTRIRGRAFYYCSRLTSVIWNAKNCWINGSPFPDITSFTFGNEVESIPRRICYEMNNLTSITIPNSVTSIGEQAFSGCSGLASVAIGNSVTNIGSSAFSGCSGLTSITIPNSVTSIGEYAFSSCSGLISMVVDGGNTVYDSRNNCNAIVETASNTLIAGCQNTIIPNSVTSIGWYAFEDCTGLTSITIPNSVTSIGWRAFYGCSSLTSVTIPNSVTSIGDGAFWGCSGLTSVTIPNSVTSIGSSTFDGCTGLTSVTIGNSVTSIGDWAFHGCSGLTSVTIPNSVTTIGDYAFSSCKGLTSITIPNSVTRIGERAFSGCSGLQNITFLSFTLTVRQSAFYGCDGIKVVYIPCGTKEDYRIAGWKEELLVEPAPAGAVSVVTEDAVKGTAQVDKQASCNNEAVISATPNYGYHFTQWNDGNTDNPRTMFLTSDTICTAMFAPNQYTITTLAQENGTVSDAGMYDYGTETTLTATPEVGYHFAQWNDGNTDNPRTVLVERDSTFIAEFAINTHKITVTYDMKMGYVSGDGTYDYGTRVRLVAEPNSGYAFLHWSDGTNYNPYIFAAIEDVTLEAVFGKATAVENTSADGSKGVQKVLRNGQIYILRNGKVYDVVGNEVCRAF